MRAKILVMLAASAVLASNAALAAEKSGKPLNIKPSIQSKHSDAWRDRAMKARAESKPVGAPSSGTARASDDRGDRPDGEESGGGRMREDRGEAVGPGE